MATAKKPAAKKPAAKKTAAKKPAAKKTAEKSKVVIVESPAKCKTIKKYLGKNFIVLASYGHVRDLIPKEGAVQVDKNFEMVYQPIERNEKHMAAIAKALAKADTLYLATDPDREGEAISWHVYEMLNEKGLLKGIDVQRVAFNEVTKTAVNEAISTPRQLSQDLVDAQQSRRALDYLVGFNLSPLLWKKIRRGLSAGRVQSPALRLITEREEEREKFVKEEYWTIEAEVKHKKQPFPSKLTLLNNEKVEQFTVNNEEQANKVIADLTKAAGGEFTVVKVEKKQRKRNPAAPFITSTLQQEAVRKLGFGAQRTMRIAQQLYEGIDVGEGAIGLITYMRTDSVNLSQDALEDIRGAIVARYGEDNLAKDVRVFKTKSKNAQEAHEAIRPTSCMRDPASIKSALSDEQFKLYDLIWKRTVACQMVHATVNTVSCDLACGSEANLFRATGSTIANPGFLAVYQEGVDDFKGDGTEKMLPPLKEGEKYPIEEIKGEQHFTEPPPRFSEATLVKALEEFGIGRPSTYASIIATLISREYVILEQKRFIPTDVGRVVNKFLTQYFTKYVDYDFTAKLEDELDEVSRGEKAWVPLMKDFWKPFKTLVDDIEENVSRAEVTQEAMDENCPKCGKGLAVRLGRRGRFIGCSGYPDCDYTRNMDGEETTASEPEVVEGRTCPKCEGPLHIKMGRYGKFIGCGNYPKCKHIEPLEKPKDMGVECPECHQSTMFKRKSRYGKVFYSCNRYPDCKYAVWYPPIKGSCPDCNWPMLIIKTTKRRGVERACPQKECKYAEPWEGEVPE